MTGVNAQSVKNFGKALSSILSLVYSPIGHKYCQGCGPLTNRDPLAVLATDTDTGAQSSEKHNATLQIEPHGKAPARNRHMHKPRWHIRAQHRPTSVSEVLDILLANRGADRSFLNGALKDLQVHVHMRGLKEGADLMARHLAQGHKIVLVGDYDCDGITSVAQMSLLLRDIGYRNFVAMIPTRAEGYGVPDRAWKDHPDARLFVALDCGTADIDAISRIRELGADCIVIDHHEVPPASAGEPHQQRFSSIPNRWDARQPSRNSAAPG